MALRSRHTGLGQSGVLATGLGVPNAAITAARDRAQRAGLADKSEFVCAEVCGAVRSPGKPRFGIVNVSLGALCWLPRVELWAEQVAALLLTERRSYLHDGHPLADALAEDQLVVLQEHFEEVEPYVEDSDRNYTNSDHPLVNRRNYSWNHGIGATVTALLRSGPALERLIEHDWTVWPRFPCEKRG